MPELQGQLQSALGDTYRLDRELGGGGMSRVFVATETALNRKIVIKFLSPELAAGVSADRFRREIQLAARLHHPHIVPLLAAGEVTVDGDTLPTTPCRWWTGSHSARGWRAMASSSPPRRSASSVRSPTRWRMPWPGRGAPRHQARQHPAFRRSCGGGRFRRRQGTHLGELDGPGADRHEHRHGDRHAGLHVAGTGDRRPQRRTRADIYALGATVYEMLGGTAPFTGPTAQSVLAAHLTKDAPSLDTLRSDLPPALASLVRRCLAKEPGDRPASASDLLRQLEQVVQPTPQPGTLASGAFGGTKRRRWVPVAAGAAALALLLTGLWSTGVLGPRSLVAEGKSTSRDAVMLARVDVVGDSGMSGALTEALRIDLGQSGVLTLVPTSQVRNALTMMRRPVESDPIADVAREVAIRTGAKAVVVGRAEPVAGQYVVTLRLISAESGDDLAAFRETAASQNELLPALDRASKELRRRIGESLKNVRASPPMQQVTTASMLALQKYTQAQSSFEREDYDRAIVLLKEAVTIDTAFAMAWRKMGVSYSNIGDKAQAVEPLRQAFAHRDRLTELERYLTDGSYYTSAVFDTPRAIAAYRSVLEIDSLDATANNNLSILLRGCRASTVMLPWMMEPRSFTRFRQRSRARADTGMPRCPWLDAEATSTRRGLWSVGGPSRAIPPSRLATGVPTVMVNLFRGEGGADAETTGRWQIGQRCTNPSYAPAHSHSPSRAGAPPGASREHLRESNGAWIPAGAKASKRHEAGHPDYYRGCRTS